MLKQVRKMVLAICALVIFVSVQLPPMYLEAASGSRTNSSAQENGFQLDGNTLVKYTGTEKSVSIPASVKKIGEAAFEGNTTMEKVTIPKGVEEIAYSAFADCTGLKTVVMSDTVETIGNSAFSNCNRLVNVSFGSGVESLGIGVFAGCDVLEGVTVDKDNEKFIVSDGALYSADKTILYQVFAGREADSYSMPSSVTKIQPYAFWGCDALKSIIISDNLKEISEYAFSNCKSLRSIQIPYSVKTIGLKAFEDCVNLRKTIIGPTVTQIHETAFDGCINLYIEAEEGTVADRFAKEHELVKTDQVEYEDTGSDDKEEIGSTIGQVAVGSKPEGMLADTYVVGNRAVLFIDNTKPMVHDGETESLPTEEPDVSTMDSPSIKQPDNENNTNTKGFSIPKLKIVEGKQIADQAYYKDASLTSYEIPKGIETIGEFSFARSGICEIEIPNGVTKIEYAAFYHCDSLSGVTIPSTVTEIAAKAFDKTAWMDNWMCGSGNAFLIVGDGILLAYRGNYDRVEIPEGVKSIAPEVFENHPEITEVHLPDSLKTVGEKAFAGCTSLNRVTGGTSVSVIKDRAYYNCPIETVRIPDTVTTIGAGAFAAPDCGLSIEERTVVFHGEKLPVITYEETAFRLSDVKARSRAFEGIGTAVVQAGTEEFEDTVLDAQELGFLGIICRVTDENSQQLTCIGTTLSEEELQDFEIPNNVYIYGIRYTVDNKDKIAALTVDKEKDFSYEGKVLFSVDSELFPDASLMAAKLEGNTSEYYIRIRDNKQAAEQIKVAYEAVYKQKLEEEAFGFEMEMIEAGSGVTIKKLGRQILQATLPVPAQLDGKTFRMVCMDEDGQLESIDYTLGEEDGVLYLTFELNHFSTFGFYVTGQIPEGADRTLATGVLDESPDTGDGVHPILFLTVGTAFLTIALLIIMGNRKKTSGIS